MPLLRRRWVAAFSGVLLLTLSVSSAFAADPVDGSDDPRGQTIAAFVHALVFGTDDESEQEPADEETLDQDEATEGNRDEEGTPDADRVDGAIHGACVSEVARDADAVGGPNDNHGGAVSEAARDTCWDEPDPEEDPTDPEVPPADEEPPADDEAESHGACVSEVARDKDALGGPNDNHGGAVSQAARETCREGADEEASGDADADELVVEDAGGGNGHGNGRGAGNGDGRGRGAGGRP